MTAIVLIVQDDAVDLSLIRRTSDHCERHDTCILHVSCLGIHHGGRRDRNTDSTSCILYWIIYVMMMTVDAVISSQIPLRAFVSDDVCHFDHCGRRQILPNSASCILYEMTCVILITLGVVMSSQIPFHVSCICNFEHCGCHDIFIKPFVRIHIR